MSDRDLDAEFARIIAGWDDEAPDPQPREPRPAEAQVAAAERDEAVESDPTGDDGDTGAQPPTATAVPETSGAPAAPTSPAAPTAPTPAGSTGQLGLPIAPTTSHSWRGSTSRDDIDDTDGSVDDDEHFVPPSEIDLPSAETDPMFWAIVGGLVGGPLLLLYLLFFDRDGSGWWIATALAMVVVGFVLLVLRGGSERDPFDDGTRL